MLVNYAKFMTRKEIGKIGRGWGKGREDRKDEIERSWHDNLASNKKKVTADRLESRRNDFLSFSPFIARLPELGL